VRMVKGTRYLSTDTEEDDILAKQGLAKLCLQVHVLYLMPRTEVNLQLRWHRE